MNEPILKTHFANRRNEKIIVQEFSGKIIFNLLPGQETILESESMDTDWARWAEVEYQIGGGIKTVQNPAWKNPLEGKRYISVFNESGGSTESIKIDGVYERFFRGVLRDIFTPISDPLVFFRRLTIKSITAKEPDRAHPDYVKEVTRTAQIKEERNPRELKRIKDEIVAAAAKKERATTDRRLGQIRVLPSIRVETNLSPRPVLENKEQEK